jgi:hypothetical protein
MTLCCLNLVIGYLLIAYYQWVEKIMNRGKEVAMEEEEVEDSAE